MKPNKYTQKSRRLLNDTLVPEYKSAIKWSFESKCPGKWVHIDCETGNLYVYNEKLGDFRQPNYNLIDAALTAIHCPIYDFLSTKKPKDKHLRKR